MPDKPSYLSSTLSQLMVLCVVAFLSAGLYAVWKTAGSDQAMDRLKWLVDVLVIGYFVRGQTEKKEPTNGQAQ